MIIVLLFTLAPAHASQEETTPVKIGVLAKRGAERCLEKWSPTAEYLTAMIPGRTFIIVPLDFKQIVFSVKNGDVDFVLANPSIYVELENRCGVSRIATLENLLKGGAHTRFGEVVFCRADNNDISSWEDLKGRSFMAVAESSLGGWRTAWREMKERGIDPYLDFTQIGVESEEGKGSTFWFTASLDKQPPVQETDVTAQEDTAVSLKGVRILVVDDNEIYRRVFAGMLASWECRHEEVFDAGTALDRLRSAAKAGDPFRIAILDMIMPETSGEALGNMIKKDPALRDTALVMTDSAGIRGDAPRLSKAGFDAYLTKPVKQSQLSNCLMTVVGRKPSDKTMQEKIITRHTIAEDQKRKIRILLAEDNIVNQKLALRLLEKMGYRADAVANGREAVEAIKTIPYDLVLMDVQMPEMDGLEATKAIRKREGQLKAQGSKLKAKDGASSNELSALSFQHSARSERVPIVALTAHAMKGDREFCIEAGMDDYVTKPIQPDKLADTIRRWTSTDDT